MSLHGVARGNTLARNDAVALVSRILESVEFPTHFQKMGLNAIDSAETSLFSDVVQMPFLLLTDETGL